MCVKQFAEHIVQVCHVHCLPGLHCLQWMYALTAVSNIMLYLQAAHKARHSAASMPSSLFSETVAKQHPGSKFVPASISQTTPAPSSLQQRSTEHLQSAGRLKSRLRSQAAAGLFASSAGPSPLANSTSSQAGRIQHEGADNALQPSADAHMRAAVTSKLRKDSDQQEPSSARPTQNTEPDSVPLAASPPIQRRMQGAGTKASLEASMTSAAQGARAARFASEASLQPHVQQASIAQPAPLRQNEPRAGTLMRLARQDAASVADSSAGDTRLAVVQQRTKWRLAEGAQL